MMNFKKTNSIKAIYSFLILFFSFCHNVIAQYEYIFWRNTILDYEITLEENINQFSNIIKKQNFSSVNRYLISYNNNIKDTVFVDKLTFNLSGLVNSRCNINKYDNKVILYSYDKMNRIINETEINNDTIEYEYKFVYPQSNKDTLSILYYYEKNKLQYKEVSFIKLVDSTKYVARDTLKTCRYNAKDSLLWCGDEIRLYNDSIIINDYLRSTSKGVKIKSRNTKIVCAKWDYKVFEEITKNHIKKIHIVFDRNERVKDFITQDYYLKNGKLFQIGDKNSWKWVFTYNHYGLPKKVTFFDENNNIIREYVYSYVAM